MYLLIKDTVSPVERCDFASVKLEKVHDLFKFVVFVGKEWYFIIRLSTAYYTTKVSVINTQSSFYVNLLK